MPFSCINTLILSGLMHVQIDPQEIVSRSDALLESATTVQGAYTLSSSTGGVSEIQFALDKPNSLVFRSNGKVEVFDGRTHTIVNLDARTYERRNVFVYGTPFLIGFQHFITAKIDGRTTRFLTYGPASYVDVAGRRYVRHTSGSGDRTITVDIDPVTFLPARWRWRTGASVYDAVLGNVTLNQPVPNALFDVPALTAGFTQVPTAEERSLPAVGAMGVNVRGRTVQGRAFELMPYVAARRATVVVFVDPNDNNSIAAARYVQSNVGSRRDVQTVYISRADDRDTTQKLVRESRISNPCLTGDAASQAISAYGVRLYPTIVVLDATGAVTARMLGYDAVTFTAAIAAPVAVQPN